MACGCVATTASSSFAPSSTTSQCCTSGSMREGFLTGEQGQPRGRCRVCHCHIARFSGSSRSAHRAGAVACAWPTNKNADDVGKSIANGANGSGDVDTWRHSHPVYMQGDAVGFCNLLEKPKVAAAGSDPVWEAIRAEAHRDADKEPILSSFLYASILAHDNLEASLAFVLANRLTSPVLLPAQLMEAFQDVLDADPGIRDAIRADIQAFYERDPACTAYSQALLYFKVLGIDIHPAAQIGEGILIDHGMGVVIGETAVVGDNVSILQGVTLGGTGKDRGDRHPKIKAGVLIGAGATILGNIVVGQGAMVAAGSLVLKPVPPHSIVAGIPATVVGDKLQTVPALDMKQDVRFNFCNFWDEEVKKQVEKQAQG
eukprot:jgi/Chlat1/1251/Chrsp115S01662